jgi:hypothetical protein
MGRLRYEGLRYERTYSMLSVISIQRAGEERYAITTTRGCKWISSAMSEKYGGLGEDIKPLIDQYIS